MRKLRECEIAKSHQRKIFPESETLQLRESPPCKPGDVRFTRLSARKTRLECSVAFGKPTYGQFCIRCGTGRRHARVTVIAFIQIQFQKREKKLCIYLWAAEMASGAIKTARMNKLKVTWVSQVCRCAGVQVCRFSFITFIHPRSCLIAQGKRPNGPSRESCLCLFMLFF